MKKILLLSVILLSFSNVQGQTADYYISNGNIMLKKGNTTSIFEYGYSSNPIIDFAEGKLNGKYYIIYWRLNGESKICTVREDGTWSEQNDFRCECGKQITKIKFIDSETLIITCNNGSRYKKTINSGGGGSESSY